MLLNQPTCTQAREKRAKSTEKKYFFLQQYVPTRKKPSLNDRSNTNLRVPHFGPFQTQIFRQSREEYS
jgi:hypothetical protein